MGMDIFVVAVIAGCGVVGGLSVVGAVRWSGERAALRFQRLFVACLVSLGGCTLMAVGQEHHCWILGAAVFGALSVAATVDYSHAQATRCEVILDDEQSHTNFAGSNR